MSAKKSSGGAIGKGGVNPAPRAEDASVRAAAEQLLMMPIEDLVPYAGNTRTHSPEQIKLLRRSLREFGFVAPVLIDFDNNIIAGHGRVEAARAEGMTEVPCVLVSNLTETQRRAYILADNRLAELSGWDEGTLRLEMEELSVLRFDTTIIGFDMPAPVPLQFGQADSGPGKTVRVQNYTRAAPGLGQNETMEDQTAEPQKTEEYRAFVDKFKPKLTTDDCYTPENVYEAVKAWAVERYGLKGREVIRPFWPGGDYQGMDYPEGCVVIDNPPFSILSDICRWYAAHCVDFFLFAPKLTLFSTASGKVNYLPVDCTIRYENGAQVNTGFVTNLGEFKIEIDPGLYTAVISANAKNTAPERELPSYVYPPEVFPGSAKSVARYGQSVRIRAKDCYFIRALDAQKDVGKNIYGSAFLLSEKAAAERAVAERAAAERAVAERAAAERAVAERAATKWRLSAREWEIVRSLGKGGDAGAGSETAYGFD